MSAFYLENIYQLFANSTLPNATIPSTLAQPPTFSPPKYAIWVNSLWFLSLATSLTGATVATLGQQWAHRYISIIQHPRYTPDQRARIRAIFAKNALGAYYIWGAGRSPLFLHLSVFLFLIGGLVYLFNLNRAAFGAVVWWVVIATSGYAYVTMDAILKPENLFYTPFSPLVLRLYLWMSGMVFRLCAYIKPLRNLCADARERCHALRNLYQYGFVEGKWMEIEEKAWEASSEIDGMVIERSLIALDDDKELGKFFDAMPGFCRSRFHQESLPSHVQTKIKQTLYGFMCRTFSSDSVPESVKSDRLITCLNTAHAVLGPGAPSETILEPLWNQVPQSVEVGHALTRWCARKIDLSCEPLRWIVAGILASVRERDVRWQALATDVFGLPERALRDHVTHGDSVLLFILIHTTRHAIHSGSWTPWVLSSHPRFNVRNTLPRLQNDFCALWNEIVTRTRENGDDAPLVDILRKVRYSFITLHQGTDAAPTAFSHFTDDNASILFEPSSYPMCTVAGHHSDSAAHEPTASSPTITPPDLLGHSPNVSPQYAPVEHPTPSLTLPDITDNSSVQGNAVTSFTLGTAGPAQQQLEETATTAPFVGFDPPQVSMPMPSLSYSTIAPTPPSYSAATQTDHTPHAPGTSASFSTIGLLSVPSQVTTVSDQHPSARIRTADTIDDAQNLNPPHSVEAFPHSGQSMPPALDLP